MKQSTVLLRLSVLLLSHQTSLQYRYFYSSICPFFLTITYHPLLLTMIPSKSSFLYFSSLQPSLLHRVVGHYSPSSLRFFPLSTHFSTYSFPLHFSKLFSLLSVFHSYNIPFLSFSHVLFSFPSCRFPPSPSPLPLPPLPCPPPPLLSSVSLAKTKTIRSRKAIREAGSALCSVVRGSSVSQRRIRFVFSPEPILLPSENYDRLLLRLVGLHATSEGNPIPCPVTTRLASLLFPSLPLSLLPCVRIKEMAG